MYAFTYPCPQSTDQRLKRPPNPATRASRKVLPRPDDVEERVILDACEGLCQDFFTPFFLPVIRPIDGNHCYLISYDWRGSRYRFLKFYRATSATSPSALMYAPFTRLDYVGPHRFDLQYIGANDKWRPAYRDVGLADAVRRIREDPMIWPS